jgi:hypothetical protein
VRSSMSVASSIPGAIDPTNISVVLSGLTKFVLGCLCGGVGRADGLGGRPIPGYIGRTGELPKGMPWGRTGKGEPFWYMFGMGMGIGAWGRWGGKGGRAKVVGGGKGG